MKASDFTDQRVRKLVKTSQENILESLEDAGESALNWYRENPGKASGLLGAGAIGTSEALQSDENKLLRTLIGAAIGGGIGYGAGLGGSELRKHVNELQKPSSWEKISEPPQKLYNQAKKTVGDKALYTGLGIGGAAGVGAGADFWRHMNKLKDINFPDEVVTSQGTRHSGDEWSHILGGGYDTQTKLRRAKSNTVSDLKKLITLGKKI